MQYIYKGTSFEKIRACLNTLDTFDYTSYYKLSKLHTKLLDVIKNLYQQEIPCPNSLQLELQKVEALVLKYQSLAPYNYYQDAWFVKICKESMDSETFDKIYDLAKNELQLYANKNNIDNKKLCFTLPKTDKDCLHLKKSNKLYKSKYKYCLKNTKLLLDLQLLQQGDNFELFGKVLTDSSEAKQKIKELNEKIEYQQKLHINFWLYHLILRLYPKLSEEYLEQAKEAYLNILKDFRVEENVYDE